VNVLREPLDVRAPRIFTIAPRGGRVHVTLHTRGGSHVIDVRNEGTGIPPEAQTLVFDRFSASM